MFMRCARTALSDAMITCGANAQHNQASHCRLSAATLVANLADGENSGAEDGSDTDVSDADEASGDGVGQAGSWPGHVHVCSC